MTSMLMYLLAGGAGYFVLSARAVASAKSGTEHSDMMGNWSARPILNYSSTGLLPVATQTYSPGWEIKAIVPSTNGPKEAVIGQTDIMGGNFVPAASF